MRRTLLVLAISLFFSTGMAHARGWHTYTSKSYHFSLHYPSTWGMAAAGPAGSWQLVSGATGKHYSVTIAALPIAPARSLPATRQRFLQYVRLSGSGDLASVRWSTTSLGGHAAFGGVLKLSTEGGVPVSNGIYVAPWRGRVYEVTVVSVGASQPPNLAKFPAVYRQILATWRFL